MKLKALIFDFDGLVIDTESPAYNSLCRIYGRFGVELPVTTFGLIVGSEHGVDFHPYTYLADRIGDRMPLPEFETIYAAELKIEYQAMKVLPGVSEMLEAAKTNGIKLAIASSSPLTWVGGYLEQFGLLHYFDEIITKDLVDRVKPAPDLFLLAAEKLDVKKNEVIIFEDSKNGVIAANSAEIPVVLIPNPITKHLEISGEALRVNSMAELTIEMLDQLLSDL
jgi:putative hydrolase of the HAD superfamily